VFGSIETKEIKEREVVSSSRLIDVHPIIEKILLSRGIDCAQQLNIDLAGLIPADFFDLQKALLILENAIAHHQKILIVGDFDVDGATSTALAVLALKAFGATQVHYLVPNRFQFGYGLSVELVEFAIANDCPDVIVTVDNGIANILGVARAKAENISVIITDHHLPGSTLPDADAIINPNHPYCPFPSKNLAGVGVIFYVMVALRTYLRERKWFQQQQITEPNIAQFLDLVALGTVADMVPLDQNNRILVHHGLKRIRAGACRLGIKALLAVGKRNIQDVSADDLGFAVAPRLNAAGRLEDMSAGIECLLCQDEVSAFEYAVMLDKINQDRKKIEEQMREEAEFLVDQFQKNMGNIPLGVCLFQPDWHQGVIGLVASRIKEKVNRPVIAFATDQNGKIKGSARSITGLHIRDLLCYIDTQNPLLIEKFGGHAMAAGLTIQEKDFEKFRRIFDETVRIFSSADLFQSVIWTDGELDAENVSLEMISLIDAYGPWGQHFPQPQFHGEFIVQQQKILNQRHIKWELTSHEASEPLEALLFFAPKALLDQAPVKVKVVYRLSLNQFAGRKKKQLLVQYAEVDQNEYQAS